LNAIEKCFGKSTVITSVGGEPLRNSSKRDKMNERAFSTSIGERETNIFVLELAIFPECCQLHKLLLIVEISFDVLETVVSMFRQIATPT
jgi:hypothetical protein